MGLSSDKAGISLRAFASGAGAFEVGFFRFRVVAVARHDWRFAGFSHDTQHPSRGPRRLRQADLRAISRRLSDQSPIHAVGLRV